MFGKSQIILSSFAGEKVARLSASTFIRKLGFGTSWTRLRVGARLMARSGTNTVIPFGGGMTPRFGVGLCASTGAAFTRNMVAGHWVGVISTGATWNVSNPGAGSYILGFLSCAPAKKVDSTLTVGTNFAGVTPAVGSYVGSAATNAHPVLYFVDIEKGSPNYSFRLFAISNPANGGNQTRAEWLTYMVEDPPVVSNYIYAAAQTVAVDESTDGTLDAINIFNELPIEIEVLDHGLVQLA